MTRLLTLFLTTIQVASIALANEALPRRESVVDISGERKIPWLDYEGIAAAAEQSLRDDLIRQGLSDEGYHWKYKRQTQNCTSVEKRIEWRQFTDTQKADYITASKCLYSASRLVSDAATTIVDDFVTLHSTNWIEFHGCAAFMPWHRWFVWLHSQALKNECGYKGPIPFWNYTMDWKDPFNSPIFSTDPKTGFGTHGTTVVSELGVRGYKLDNGAFANLQVNIPKPHFITRNFTGWKSIDPTGRYGTALGTFFNPDAVKQAMAAKNFGDLETIMDGLKTTNNLGIHNGPHFFQNGDWSGPSWLQGTSYFPQYTPASNDPMFWPHHAYVDHVFWDWQQLPGNQFSYGGTKSNGQAAKSSDMLPLYSWGPDVPISTALKTENYPLCYTY